MHLSESYFRRTYKVALAENINRRTQIRQYEIKVSASDICQDGFNTAVRAKYPLKRIVRN